MPQSAGTPRERGPATFRGMSPEDPHPSVGHRRPPRRWLVLGAAVVLIALSTGALLLGRAAAPSQSVARVSIEPNGLLFTELGQARPLRAVAINGAGELLDVPIRWTALKPGTVSIDSLGTASAVAFGSGQIVAEAGGARSTPLLAVVAKPAPGVTIVSDDQVLGDPVEADPSAEPSASNSYRVTLSAPLAPKAGDLLIGSGAKPVAGRVEAVEAVAGGTSVVMRLVPLEQLLPDLDIHETLDLATAPIAVPDEVARLYDIHRAGNRFDFVPRADFQDLVAAQGASLPSLRGLAGAKVASVQPLLVSGPVGTRALGPFECKFATTPGAESTPLTLSGSLPPAFSVEISPSLDITYTPANGLERFVASATVKAKVAGGVKVTVAFEGKVSCEVELFQFRIPVGGALSFFVSGLVPIKAGLEIGGKLTVAGAELAAESSAEATISVGVVCPGGSACTLQRDISGEKREFKPKVDGPSWTDLRLEPGFELSAGMDLDVGNPFFQALRLELVKTKVGAKLSADWAPQAVQIKDAAYVSSYKLSVEAGASIGAQLGEAAQLLGLGNIAAYEFKFTKDIATSPTGTAAFDRASYAAGEGGVAHVELTEATVQFLGAYNVARVLLVRHTPTEDVVLGHLDAGEGQRAFDVAFTAPVGINARDLHAFVVTKATPFDVFALELARACDQTMDATWVRYVLQKTYYGTLTAPDGSTTEESIYFDPPSDDGGGGLAVYFRNGESPITIDGRGFVGGGWNGTFSIACDADGRRARLEATSSLGRFEGMMRGTLPSSPNPD